MTILGTIREIPISAFLVFSICDGLWGMKKYQLQVCCSPDL